VLWGPPGVGKTLATERIEETLRRRREQNGMCDRRLNGTTSRATGVPELRHFSFADAEDGKDMTAMVRDIGLWPRLRHSASASSTLATPLQHRTTRSDPERHQRQLWKQI
jgi:hypothetical protein